MVTLWTPYPNHPFRAHMAQYTWYFSKDSAGGQVGYPKTSQALDSCVETTETSLRCVNEWTQQNSSAPPEADAHWLATWISHQAPLLEWTEGSVHLPTSDTWDTRPLLASRHPWEGCRSHVCPVSCLPALGDALNIVKHPQNHQTSMFSVMWWQWELQWNPPFCDFCKSSQVNFLRCSKLLQFLSQDSQLNY